ncbi:hypothetical protein LRX75_21565 [Rhizobium sp. DKSPLA3]|uniref:Uncharacterized protein n=1 Tax=Rhizobium quercicola TaxID=2901226 RepID=A0A9X1T2C0_9HYPH|nr:hypothetical protein [Rhizobium quercicola]MCD7111626.1 hypothetical protein [Rhizobium quercicola]
MPEFERVKAGRAGGRPAFCFPQRWRSLWEETLNREAFAMTTGGENGFAIALQLENGFREIEQEHDTNHCRHDHHDNGHVANPYLVITNRRADFGFETTSERSACTVAKIIVKNISIENNIKPMAIILSAPSTGHRG